MFGKDRLQFALFVTLFVVSSSVGWSTRGSQIKSPSGESVILKSISWYGFETQIFVVHGLWANSMRNILDLVKSSGFNSLRIPWSNDIINNPIPSGIDFNLNPDLKGLTCLQILDYLVDRCTERGIYVILDRHRPNKTQQSELWYTGAVSQQKWINDWQSMALRYKNKPIVIAADLHNQPHGSSTWGNSNPSTDWNKAAQKCGNAILSVAPNWLIIVEGIEHVNDDWYWWGGNLAGATSGLLISLSVPNKVIYSPHDYGPEQYNQRWFNEDNFPQNMPNIWNSHWATLHTTGIAPIWLGQFGIANSDPNQKPGKWFGTLLDFIKSNKLNFAYWCLNGYDDPNYGLLSGDWKTIKPNKLSLLKRILQ